MNWLLEDSVFTIALVLIIGGGVIYHICHKKGGIVVIFGGLTAIVGTGLIICVWFLGVSELRRAKVLKEGTKWEVIKPITKDGRMVLESIDTGKIVELTAIENPPKMFVAGKTYFTLRGRKMDIFPIDKKE